MSTQAMKWAWDVVPGSATGRLVLLALAEHSDPAGVSFPSIRRIAEFAMTSEGTVKRRLKEFEAAGVLAVFEREDPKTGRQTSNEYRLQMQRDPASFVITDGAPKAGDAEADRAYENYGNGPGEGSTMTPSPPLGGSHPGESGEGVTQVSPLEPPVRTNTPLPPESEPEAEAERAPFGTFRLAWAKPMAGDAAAAEILWDALTAAEQLRVIATIPEWQRCCAQRAGPRFGKASAYLRQRTFDDPALLPKPKPVTVFVEEHSEAWKAWLVFARLYGRPSLPTCSSARGGRGWNFPSEHPPIGRGIELPAVRPWVFIRHGTQQSGAWINRLQELAMPNWPSGPPRVSEGGHDGFMAPMEWPPPKGSGTGEQAA